MKNTFLSAAIALLLIACAPLSASETAAIMAPDMPKIKADDPKLDFSVAQTIAVQEDRRKKPLQTYAFESVEQFYGRPLFGPTVYKDTVNKVTLDSMDLFLSIWFFPEYWFDKPLILVSNSELRAKLTMPIAVMGADAGAYVGTDKELVFDEKRFSMRDLVRGPLLGILKELTNVPDDQLTSMQKEAKLIYKRAELFNTIAGSTSELAIVPHQNDSQGTWHPMEALLQAVAKLDGNPEQQASMVYNFDSAKNACVKFEAFKAAYKKRDPEAFATASRDFKTALMDLSPKVYPTDTTLNVEVSFNNTRPFAWAWVFYLCASITALFSLRFKGKGVYAAAMTLYLIGLGLHVYGFALRCYVAGRPPVSNMYESVVWVGFGVVMFGLIFEVIYRRRYYMLAGSFAGFLCLVLMDMVPVMYGDSQMLGFNSSLEPLQPVLRDNFWLTIHVLTITLSYAAFMLAWGMGHITLWSHLTRPTQRAEHHELHDLVYRVMQIGVLLLAIGTILGGVWAYYSWGRFWGWDPKETWAFIALMCYIVVLHGRFAGLWTNFGLAFGSIFCFQAIVMAWYGVNFVLGSGKHSYGSGAGGREIVLTCVAADLTFLFTATWQYIVHRYEKYQSPFVSLIAGLAVAATGLGVAQGAESIKPHLATFFPGLSHGPYLLYIGVTVAALGAAVLDWGCCGAVIQALHGSKSKPIAPSAPPPPATSGPNQHFATGE